MTLQTNDPKIVQLLTEVGIIEQLATNQLEQNLPDGLKVSQFAVLNHLVRLGGDWSPLRLANAMQVTKGAMTNTLQRLEKRGLVIILDDPKDGRKKFVNITDAGKEMREDCITNISPLLAELTNELSEAEISQALPLLTKLRTLLDSKR